MTKVNRDVLEFIQEHEMIDMGMVDAAMKKEKIKKYLKQHNRKITMGTSRGKQYYCTYLPKGPRNNSMIRAKTKEELEEKIATFYEQREENPMIDEVFRRWSEDKLKYKEVRHQTYDKYKSEYQRYFIDNPNANELRRKHIEDITEDDIETFIRATIADQELTRKSFTSIRLFLNGIFKYAKKRK